jgi:hypothetical protein
MCACVYACNIRKHNMHMEDVHILIKKRPESSGVDYKICSSNLCDLKYRRRA